MVAGFIASSDLIPNLLTHNSNRSIRMKQLKLTYRRYTFKEFDLFEVKNVMHIISN